MVIYGLFPPALHVIYCYFRPFSHIFTFLLLAGRSLPRRPNIILAAQPDAKLGLGWIWSDSAGLAAKRWHRLPACSKLGFTLIYLNSTCLALE
jgi:hypothetical protein